MSEVNFSIVIPHFNSYSLLQRCLLSIPFSKDIQVIVVDDYSPNQSALINVIDKFKNVELIVMSKNSGAGKARNEGLRRVTGKWVIFADADDYFTDTAFDIFRDNAEKKVDIVYYKVIGKDSQTGELDARGSEYNRLINNYDPLKLSSVDMLKYRYYVPWGKMIRSDFIRNNKLQFEEVKYSNDVMFGMKLAHCANNIEVCDSSVYCITAAKNSLTRNKSESAFMCRYEVAVRQAVFLKKIKKSIYGALLFRFILKSTKYGCHCTRKVLKIGINAKVNFFAGARRILIKQ